ncbi:MAG: hypothetical protein ABW139_07545 [Candidatus Thiodiazotropha sp. DIVDIV]
MGSKPYSSNKEVLARDPIGQNTRLAKRNLLVFSSIVIIGITYGPGAIELPMTNLPSETLLGALGCIVAYHIISYTLSFVTDVQGWHITNRNTVNEDQLRALAHLSQRMNEIDHEFKRVHSHLSSHRRVYKEQSEKLSRQILQNLQDMVGPNNAQSVLDNLRANYDTGFIFDEGYTEINKAMMCNYDKEVKNISGMLEYFYTDAKQYRKLERLIKREVLQLKITQYFVVYFWSFILPLSLGLFAVICDFELIIVFINSLL